MAALPIQIFKPGIPIIYFDALVEEYPKDKYSFAVIQDASAYM
jgi:hypothetical protein